MRHILIPLALASAAVADAAVTVRDIAVENGSFEAYELGDGQFTFNRPVGWTTRGTADTAGRALGIRSQTFYDLDQGNEVDQVNVDNVRVTATG